jgi:hypothetical protein
MEGAIFGFGHYFIYKIYLIGVRGGQTSDYGCGLKLYNPSL